MVISRRALLLGLTVGWASLPQERAAPPASLDRVGEIEWHILFLTNQQRIWQKVATLQASPALADVARAHSRDMLARGYFDHFTPEKLSPKDRVTRHGLKFSRIAENIYSTLDGSADAAEVAWLMVDGWMHTAGHRRNILDPSLQLLGVGVAATDRQIIATQLFAA